MAITPVNPSTGLPNSSPAYFPAFTPTWTIPPFPPVGQGNWELAPPVVQIADTPEMRTPPFAVGDTGVVTPPSGGTDRGTFTTWDDVVAEIEDAGVDTNDTFEILEAQGGFWGAGTYQYDGPNVAAGAGPFTLQQSQWKSVGTVAAAAKPRTKQPKPKGRNHKK